MKHSIRLVSALIAAGSFAAAAYAGDDVPVYKIPDEYLVGRAPEGMQGRDHAAAIAAAAASTAREKSASGDRASAINGTLYAVVAPTFNNPNGALSYIRLFNGQSTASTFSITVVGSPSGRTMGTASISVARSASPQRSLTQIITLANAGALTGGDTGYSLYIQNAQPATGFQHVVFNAANGFFENYSVCKSLLDQSVATVANSTVLTNIHTSKIPTYPSQIEIHNYWNAAVAYRVTLVDSEAGTASGNPLGTISVETAPNASYSMPFSFFESKLATPLSATQVHVNMIVTDPSGAPPYEVMGQSIVNQQLGANINMSTICSVNPVNTSSTTTEGPGLNGY